MGTGIQQFLFDIYGPADPRIKKVEKARNFIIDDRSPADGPWVRQLARHIRGIVAPGAPRYDTPSYKYACPRVAGNLEKFADHLDEHPRRAEVRPTA